MVFKTGLPVLFIGTVIFVLFVTILQVKFQPNQSNTILLKNHSTDKTRKTLMNLQTFQHSINNHSTGTIKKNLLNLRNFQYIINNNCTSTFIVWIVTSYAGNPSMRNALRKSYSKDELQELGIQRIFLLGALKENYVSSSGVSQSDISDESEKFQDIIQGNFMEAYRNLTYKHTMGLKWIKEHCESAKYIIKTDDDIIIDLYTLIEKIKISRNNDSNNNRTDNVLLGYVFKNSVPIRDPSNKWFVTLEEYPLNFYPDFVSGWMYITTVNVVKKIVNQLNNYPKYFWIDDLFLTGIVRHELKIETENIGEIFTTDPRFFKCCMRDKEKLLKCDFAVGPNGGDAELQVGFHKYLKYCLDKCERRTKSSSVRNTCITVMETTDFLTGNGFIHPLKIK